jgi:hypothetical protein
MNGTADRTSPPRLASRHNSKSRKRIGTVVKPPTAANGTVVKSPKSANGTVVNPPNRANGTVVNPTKPQSVPIPQAPTYQVVSHPDPIDVERCFPDRGYCAAASRRIPANAASISSGGRSRLNTALAPAWSPASASPTARLCRARAPAPAFSPSKPP